MYCRRRWQSNKYHIVADYIRGEEYVLLLGRKKQTFWDTILIPSPRPAWFPGLNRAMRYRP